MKREGSKGSISGWKGRLGRYVNNTLPEGDMRYITQYFCESRYFVLASTNTLRDAI